MIHVLIRNNILLSSGGSPWTACRSPTDPGSGESCAESYTRSPGLSPLASSSLRGSWAPWTGGMNSYRSFFQPVGHSLSRSGVLPPENPLCEFEWTLPTGIPSCAWELRSWPFLKTCFWRTIRLTEIRLPPIFRFHPNTLPESGQLKTHGHYAIHTNHPQLLPSLQKGNSGVFYQYDLVLPLSLFLSVNVCMLKFWQKHTCRFALRAALRR